MPKVELQDIQLGFIEELDDLFAVKKQEISDQFLSRLADIRQESNKPAEDFHLFAEIPVIFVEQWLKEGFDIYRASLKEIEAKLRKENLERFIATNKRLY